MKNKILAILLACASFAYGGIEYGKTVFMDDVSVGTYYAISNMTWRTTSGGTYTNAGVDMTNYYRISGTNLNGKIPVSTNIIAYLNGHANTNAYRITWPFYSGLKRVIIERSIDEGNTWTNWIAEYAYVTNFTDYGTNEWNLTAWSASAIPAPSVPWVAPGASSPVDSREFTNNIIPDANNAYDIGSESKRTRTNYVTYISFGGGRLVKINGSNDGIKIGKDADYGSGTGIAIGYQATNTGIGVSIGLESLAGEGSALGNAATTAQGASIGSGASSDFGAAAGQAANSTDGGGAVGYSTVSYKGGGAIGYDASATRGGASVGWMATCDAGAALGSNANAKAGAAIGWKAKTIDGLAGGVHATSANGVAVGAYAESTGEAVQLGRGTNDTDNTVQFFNTPVMDANGNIYILTAINPASGSTTNMGNFVPSADSSYDIGSATRKWRYVTTSDGAYLGHLLITNTGNDAVFTLDTTLYNNTESIIFCPGSYTGVGSIWDHGASLAFTGNDAGLGAGGRAQIYSGTNTGSIVVLGIAGNTDIRINRDRTIELLNTVTNTGDFIPGADGTYNLGSPTRQWAELYLSGSTIYMEGTNVFSYDADNNIVTIQGTIQEQQGTNDPVITVKVGDAITNLVNDAGYGSTNNPNIWSGAQSVPSINYITNSIIRFAGTLDGTNGICTQIGTNQYWELYP